MAYCTNCGSPIKEDEKFCSSCGVKIEMTDSSSEKEPVFVRTPDSPKKELQQTRQSRKMIDSGSHPEKNIQNVQVPVKKKKKRGCLGCLGKGLLIFLGVIITGIVIIFFLPDTSETEKMLNALPPVQKGQDLEKVIGVNAIEIGNLEENNIQLSIPEKTFRKSHVKLEINEGSDAPDFSSERAIRTGPVFKILIDQKSKRLKKPVKVRLRLFKPENVEIEHPDDFWIAYYNGKQWDYFKPLSVDLQDGFIEFETFHFSWFSEANPTKEERIKNFAEKEAISRWAKKNYNQPTKRATEIIVKQVLLDKLGIKNKSFTQDVVESMMNEDDYAKLLVSYNDNNMEQFGQDVAILAGKKIVEITKKYGGTANKLLGGVTGHASKINAGINITRALSQGDYEKAAKELSLEIINTYPITKLYREAARITQKQIDRWKNDELEAAYQVYLKGSESSIPFWGYNVEPGNFEEVWNQMKGLQAQILRDGIKEYGIKHNIDVSKLGYTSLNRIRKQVKRDLRKEFEKRKKEEAEIEKIKQENLKLIEEFESADLLTKYRFGYTEQTSYDLMLRRLFLVKDMILKDTGSRIGFTGVEGNGIISAKRVARLIQIWYGKNGKERYREELVRLGYKKKEKVVNLDMGNTSEMLPGTWEGYFQITKNKYVESMTKSAAYVFKAVGLGKDEAESLAAARGVFEEPEGLKRKRKMKMVVTSTGRNNKYNLKVTIEGDGASQTYKTTMRSKKGQLEYELKDASGSFHFEGKIVLGRKMSGTFYIGSKMFEAAEGIWEIKKVK